MDIAFEAIGIEIPSEKAFNLLAERAGTQGEPTKLARRDGIWHGRCWKLGDGLEVWTVMYESDKGEVFYADCRPSFRAQYRQSISPWALTEYDEEGEAIIHGYCENTATEVLFELQNLTEIGLRSFQVETLQVGLCGLAYRAEVLPASSLKKWKPLAKTGRNTAKYENDWSLSGEILDFRALRNPLSGNSLFWIYVALIDFNLEILVNQKCLRGESLQIGKLIGADIWLQGHVIDEVAGRSRYEGIDPYTNISAFWQHLRRYN